MFCFNRLPRRQIMNYSQTLNQALDKLKNVGPWGPSQGGNVNSNSNKKREHDNSILGNMISVVLGLFSTNDSLLLLIGLFIGI